jgi:hypothetical protein
VKPWGSIVLLAILAGLFLWNRWLDRRTRKHTTQPPPPRAPLDFPHVAPPILHLLEPGTERPICGASIREAWTIVPETATCPECRKQGDLAMLQWYANNR